MKARKARGLAAKVATVVKKHGAAVGAIEYHASDPYMGEGRWTFSLCFSPMKNCRSALADTPAQAIDYIDDYLTEKMTGDDQREGA